jgi:hypothetical protein
MLIRVLFIYIALTTVAVALHDNTFAVFELREQLQMLFINMWELLTQLVYVNSDQRVIVYREINDIQQQISATIDQIREHDQAQHD